MCYGGGGKQLQAVNQSWKKDGGCERKKSGRRVYTSWKKEPSIGVGKTNSDPAEKGGGV